MIELKVLDSVFEISEYTYRRMHSVGNLGSAALSFGSTYSRIFTNWKKLFSAELLSEALHDGSGISNLPSFFPADERMVGFEDPDSNWGTCSKLFLSSCASDRDIARHPKTVEGYNEILSEFFPGPPAFDITFLGLGPDGHTASLFPENCPDETAPEWMSTVLQTKAPSAPRDRLSLGPELIAESRQLLIVVTGEAKTAILEKFLTQLTGIDSLPPENKMLPPVKIIRRREKLNLNTLILADKDAAEKIPLKLKTGYIK